MIEKRRWCHLCVLEVMVVVVMVMVDADLVQKGQHAEAASFKETDNFTAMNPCVMLFIHSKPFGRLGLRPEFLSKAPYQSGNYF